MRDPIETQCAGCGRPLRVVIAGGEVRVYAVDPIRFNGPQRTHRCELVARCPTRGCDRDFSDLTPDDVERIWGS